MTNTFRQMTPTIGTTDFEVHSDAYAALFDKIGPGVFITHSQGGPLDGIHCLRRETLRLSRHTNRVERFLFRKGNCRRRLSLLRFPRKWKALKYLCPYSWNIPRSLSSFIMEIILPETDERRSYMNGHAVCA